MEGTGSPLYRGCSLTHLWEASTYHSPGLRDPLIHSFLHSLSLLGSISRQLSLLSPPPCRKLSSDQGFPVWGEELREGSRAPGHGPAPVSRQCHQLAGRPHVGRWGPEPPCQAFLGLELGTGATEHCNLEGAQISLVGLGGRGPGQVGPSEE